MFRVWGLGHWLHGFLTYGQLGPEGMEKTTETAISPALYDLRSWGLYMGSLPGSMPSFLAELSI